jgi:hypothetical protein
LATELLGGPAIESDAPAAALTERAERAQAMSESATPVPFVEGQRQRHTAGPLKRGIHELRDPRGWPAEPAPVVGAPEA